MTTKILVLSGSVRAGSFNRRLAALAVKQIALADAEPTWISLADYPLPLYDADLEAGAGVPPPAEALVALLAAHDGVLIAAPEYNAGVTPLLKNALDWMSRVAYRGAKPRAVFHNRAFALVSASPGSHGGLRGLMALRQVLELGLGAPVLPDQVTVADAASAFRPNDDLADAALAGRFRALIERLVERAGHFGQL